jgi:hypothetical protein
VGQALLTIFTLAAAVQGNWQNALALALFFGVAEFRMINVVKWKHELSKLQQQIGPKKWSSSRHTVLSM